MKRLAMVDARGLRLFVTSYSTTQDGAFVQGDWVEAADEPVDDRSLGSLARSALAACRAGLPYPDFRKGPTPERLKLLALAGVKSEAQYARGTREISVEWDSGPAMIITPHLNGGRRSGFTEMLDQVVTLDATSDDAALGAAIRAALDIATDGT